MGAMAMAMLASPALAQAPASAPASPQASAPAGGQAVQEIVITGVRASVGNALQLKKSATQPQDSSVAEDIGKLPDNNVVEALQHVTGISIIRNNIEPSTVLIRGLPDIATTLNSRSIFTSSGRFISLPDLPAELLSRVDVKKTAEADDLEGGIAGLINVELHRPFDFRTPQVAGGFQETYGTLSQKWAPNGNVLLSDRWSTGIGEIGALVDVSYQKHLLNPDRIYIFQDVFNEPMVGAGSGPGVNVPPGNAAYVNSVTLTEQPSMVERTAINASFQWRPNDKVETFAEFFGSRLRNQTPVDVNVILEGVCPNAAASKPFPGTNIGQYLASGCYGLTSMQDRRAQEDTYQAAAGGRWYVTDKLTLKTEFDYTHSNDQTVAYIPDAQYNYGPGGQLTNLNVGNGGTSITQPGNPQMSPNTYLDQFYDTRNPVRSGREYDVRLDGNYKIGEEGIIRSVDAGYRYADHGAISDGSAFAGLNCATTTGNGSVPYNKYVLDAINSPACVAYRAGLTATSVGGVSYGSLPAGAYTATQHSFFDGKYGTSSWVNIDPNYLWDHIETFRSLFGYSGVQDYVPTNHFGVSEVSHAGYVKLNYGLTIAGVPLDGNVGVRIVQTTLTENAYTQQYVPADPTKGPTQGANATCVTCVVYTPVTAKKTDTQVLPSFNLRAKLEDGLFLRAGVSKTITRPTFAQLNPSTTLSGATATLLATATSGNPNLAPEQSSNYDLDLSYYWGRANHASIAAFYRQVTGYIQNGQSPLTVAGTTYILTQPTNSQNADIKGVEIGYSQFFDFLPGIWSGFGWDVNGTYTDAVFYNVAKYHVNIAAIYEKGPYSFRFSWTYNSPYEVGPFSSGAQPQFTYASVRENADLSLNYRLNERLTFTFDATNLFDNYQIEHAGAGPTNALLFPTNFERFDRTFSLGVRFRM